MNQLIYGRSDDTVVFEGEIDKHVQVDFGESELFTVGQFMIKAQYESSEGIWRFSVKRNPDTVEYEKLEPGNSECPTSDSEALLLELPSNTGVDGG